MRLTEMERQAMKMTDADPKDLIWASAFYLTKPLPSGFQEWTEKALDDFLEAHAWSPLEGWLGVQIWQQIESLAYAVKSYKEESYRS